MAKAILYKEAQETIEQMEKDLTKEAMNQIKATQLDLDNVKRAYEERIKALDEQLRELDEQKKNTSDGDEAKVRIQANISNINRLKNNLERNYKRYTGGAE